MAVPILSSIAAASSYYVCSGKEVFSQVLVGGYATVGDSNDYTIALTDSLCIGNL